MAYADYGGYAWLDGKFMPENCDTLIGDNMYHVVLGAGSAKVGMRKQSITDVYIHNSPIALPELDDFYDLVESEKIVSIDVGYSELRVAYRYTDNYYQFVELRGMAGGTWHGFSGYGVGAGLEYCGSGYSTEAQIKKTESLFDIALERPKP